jgi:hypothetical protein
MFMSLIASPPCYVPPPLSIIYDSIFLIELFLFAKGADRTF